MLLETSPVTFLVESRHGVLALMKTDFEDDPKQAAALRQDLEKWPGDRTEEVKSLEEYLKTLPRNQ